MGRKARIQLISFSDPLLREETTAGMEQWYEYDAQADIPRNAAPDKRLSFHNVFPLLLARF